MNKTGPIIIIEDDKDDQKIFADIFVELACGNEVKFFDDGLEALKFLESEDIFPFIIISDINMPKVDGFALRNMIQANPALNKKCIPYIFVSTSATEKTICKAYTMSVQGFFKKPITYAELLDSMKTIITYWQKCYTPTN